MPETGTPIAFSAQQGDETAVNNGAQSRTMTRATSLHEAEVVTFKVWGYKNNGTAAEPFSSYQTVFPRYTVNWIDGSAATTTSNSSGWEYVAQEEDGDNVQVTIITDGEENSSEEWTLKMVRTMIEKLKKQHWTFTLIGTDALDVEGMAHSFAIEEHMEFQQTEAGTRAMFACERRSRERYNCCIAEDAAMPIGSFFNEDES